MPLVLQEMRWANKLVLAQCSASTEFRKYTCLCNLESLFIKGMSTELWGISWVESLKWKLSLTVKAVFSQSTHLSSFFCSSNGVCTRHTQCVCVWACIRVCVYVCVLYIHFHWESRTGQWLTHWEVDLFIWTERRERIGERNWNLPFQLFSHPPINSHPSIHLPNLQRSHSLYASVCSPSLTASGGLGGSAGPSYPPRHVQDQLAGGWMRTGSWLHSCVHLGN